MGKRILQGAVVLLVLAIVGVGTASAFCETTIRQAEAQAAKVEASARATTGGVSADLQARLDRARALVKEAWDLRNGGDHSAALAKAKAALALLAQPGSPHASRMPSRRYAY